MKILKIEKENDKIIVYYKKKLFEKFEIDFHQFFICDNVTYQPYSYETKGNIVCIKYDKVNKNI